jgi:hypothetical protein
MGHRTVKRVPLDFFWPLHKVWDGYVNREGGQCPNNGKTCFSGYTSAGKWLDAIARLIAMVCGEAADASYAEEFRRRGRIYPHPYLQEWQQAPYFEMPPDVLTKLRAIEDPIDRNRAFSKWHRENPPQLLPLTVELVTLGMGLGVEHLGGLSGSEVSWRIANKLREVAGLPETWGTCPVCEGHGDDPTKRERAEAWKETEPPKGDGWQLWETCTEGSPISPVFPTAEALADWATINATVFADCKTTREKWLTIILGEETEGALDVGSLGMVDTRQPERGLDAVCNFTRGVSTG